MTSPESPVIGRVSITTYPVQEAQGLIFVYVGDGEPPPLAHDVCIVEWRRLASTQARGIRGS